jgi:signal transduction histidine kinase
MRFRTWPLSALGLAALLVLVMGALWAATGKAQEIYGQLDELNQYHRNVEGKLREVRDQLQISGILARDYVLAQDRPTRLEYRGRLDEARRNTRASVEALSGLIIHVGDARSEVDSLRTHLDDYWSTYAPLFARDPDEGLAESVAFIRAEVLPRRRSVLAIAEEIEELNDANMAAQRAEVARRQAEFRRDLTRLLWLTLALGLGVAVTVVARLHVLEGRAAQQRQAAEHASAVMRQLSQQLVATQEEERRKLSRELHDHVGQMLTALRLELGRIERLRGPGGGAIAGAVAESRVLVDQIVRTVRDLALGLRPSMLDDLGLQPALEWHVRDFTRRSGIAVDLRVDGTLDGVPDPHGTCIYRLVQEALTNCARHAGATRLDVHVRGSRAAIDVGIRDDGRGFDPSAPRGGVGLRGLEERVKELGGSLTVRSAPGIGTELHARVPLPASAGEKRLATVAG